MILTGLFLSALGNSDFVQSTVDAPGDSFDYEIYDINQDGRKDVIVTTAEHGRRELRVHLQRPTGAMPPTPDWQMTLPPDVTAYALLDVRPAPGLEIALLTRSGVFTVTTTQASLRDNLRRDIALPIFPDLPRREALKLWPMVSDLDGDGREDLFVMSNNRWTVMGARASEEDADALEFGVKLQLEAQHIEEKEERAEITFGQEASFSAVAAPRFFPNARSSRASLGEFAWLSHHDGWRPPTLFDWDTDGRLDIVERRDGAFFIRCQDSDGGFEPAPLELRLPAALGALSDWTASFRDLDDDQRFELALEKEIEDEDEHVFTVLSLDEDGQFAGTPTARIKLRSMSATFELVDVDRDGNLDLTVRTVDIPGGISRLTNVRLDVSFQVYMGLPDAQLARRPSLRIDRRYRPEELARIQESLILNVEGDYDGDGLGDLLTLQTSGLLELTKLQRSGDEFELAEEPFASYRPPSAVLRAWPLDLSPDGVSDLLLRHAKSLSFFISHTGEAP